MYPFAGCALPEPLVIIPETEDQPDENEPEKEVHGIKITCPHKGFRSAGYSALRLRYTPTIATNEDVIGMIGSEYTFTVHKEYQIGDDLWWLVELPNH